MPRCTVFHHLLLKIRWAIIILCPSSPLYGSGNSSCDKTYVQYSVPEFIILNNNKVNSCQAQWFPRTHVVDVLYNSQVLLDTLLLSVFFRLSKWTQLAGVVPCWTHYCFSETLNCLNPQNVQLNGERNYLCNSIAVNRIILLPYSAVDLVWICLFETVASSGPLSDFDKSFPENQRHCFIAFHWWNYL